MATCWRYLILSCLRLITAQKEPGRSAHKVTPPSCRNGHRTIRRDQDVTSV
jgi:hypothetical protein